MTPPPLQDFTFLIFSIIPLLDVIVLTMKTKFTIPILQGALQLKKTTKQMKEKLNQLYILYSNTVCFWHYQGITIHTMHLSLSESDRCICSMNFFFLFIATTHTDNTTLHDYLSYATITTLHYTAKPTYRHCTYIAVVLLN